jgi:GNAT superfamily N-acetyltransferase
MLGRCERYGVAGKPPAVDRARSVREIPAESPEAQRLLTAFRDEMRERYVGLDTAAGRAEPVTPEGLVPPKGRFLGLYVDRRLVACGGIRLLEPGVAEIKRMYVARDLRRRGLGRQILAALEQAARSLGCDRIQLDTGERQPEAKALYIESGYGTTQAYNEMPPGTFWAEKKL